MYRNGSASPGRTIEKGGQEKRITLLCGERFSDPPIKAHEPQFSSLIPSGIIPATSAARNNDADEGEAYAKRKLLQVVFQAVFKTLSRSRRRESHLRIRASRLSAPVESLSQCFAAVLCCRPATRNSSIIRHFFSRWIGLQL